MPRWLIYALGGGLGHVTRALGLAHAASRLGQQVEVLSNSPFLADLLPIATRRWPDLRIEPIDADLDRQAVAARVDAHLAGARFDLLVVDTFPRGLAGELESLLPALRLPKVLVHRDLTPAYVAAKDLGSFVASYDLVLLPGEKGPLARGAEPERIGTDPWLCCDAHELWPRAKARARLGADGDRPLVLVLGTGSADEARAMAALAQDLARALGSRALVRCCAPPGVTSHASAACGPPSEEPSAIWHWPALELFAGVDVLIGAAGYNTVAEARAASIPLLCIVRQRRYDRQRLRVDGEHVIELPNLDPDAVAERVQRLLGAARSGLPSFPNGARDAAQAIVRLGARHAPG